MSKENYFENLKEKFLNKLVFIDVKRDAIKSFNYTDGEFLSLPIYYDNFNTGINSGEYSEDIPLNDIVEGIAIVLACNNEFKLKDIYLELLSALNANIEKYIFSLAMKNVEKKEYELAYIFFEFLSNFYINDKIIKYNKGLSLLYMTNNKAENEKNELADECIKLFEDVKEEDGVLGADNLGHLYAYKREYEKALLNYEIFLDNFTGDKTTDAYDTIKQEYDSTNNIVQFENGVFNFENKKYEKALEYFLPLVEVTEDWFALFFLIGKCYRAANNVQKALKYFEKAYKLDKTSPDLNNELGLCYYILRDIAKAKVYITRANELEVDNVVFLMNLCSIYMELKDYKNAKRLIETTLKISPTDEIALKCNEIIEKQSEKGKDLK